MTINESQDKIIEEFSNYKDWFDKYEALIKLANELEPLEEKHKREENSIAGCQSEVWIKDSVENGKMRFFADSDTKITKGIIALLLKVLNDNTPSDIAEANLYFIDEIGLGTNLSPSRSNGLQAIISEIKSRASKAY